MRWINEFTLLVIVCFLVGCSSSEDGSIEPDVNTPQVTSSSWVQRIKLEPGTDTDFSSVFLSGDRALIGGSGSIDDFTRAVKLYERNSEGSWVDVASLAPTDLASGDLFGSSMSLFGNTAMIVSAGDDDTGFLDGSAYVFEKNDAAEWTEVLKILPDEEAGMGAVSIDGERALLGGSDFGKAFSGVGYIYERDLNGIWQRIASLRPNDTAGYDLLGLIGDGVSLSGNRALLSSPRDSQNGDASGAVYLYERENDGVWREQAKLMASDGSANDFFGVSVSLNEDYALIGQLNAFRPSHPSSVYVFERNVSGDWLEVAKLIAFDSVNGDQFGRSVSLSAERALISAPGDGGSRPGAVYEFERNSNGDWLEVNKISVDENSDSFGWSISLSGDRALIAAPSADNSQPGDGVVYIFEKSDE